MYHDLDAKKLVYGVSKTIFKIRQVLSGFCIWSSLLRHKFHPIILVEATWCGVCHQTYLGFSKGFLFVEQGGGGGGIWDIDSKQGD